MQNGFGKSTAWWAIVVGAAASGCADNSPQLGEHESASTVVGDYQSSTGCSTAVVIGLSKQIAEEAGCENPASFVSFSGAAGVTLTSNAVLPYLVKGARADLETVAASSSLQITSALRTLAQQYLLYRWYEEGRCGITAAATVGNSNHEGGRAVDLANYSARISAMSAHGWAHDVPGDVVHFDHTASPDDRGQDVKAFQVLWNRNHPNDLIAEDGEYGPQTEARLVQSPATGFALGPSCTTAHVDAELVSVDGPDGAPPITQIHYALVVNNTSDVDWPATTQLATSDGGASVLHDASWTSPSIVTTLGAVAAGTLVPIELDVMTPAVDAATPITQVFALVDGATTYGTFSVTLTVAPDADTQTSGEGSEKIGDESGGCNAGGVPGWLALAAPLILRRRRRATLDPCRSSGSTIA